MWHTLLLLVHWSITFICIILKDLDQTSQKTYSTSITKANRNVSSQFILRIVISNTHCAVYWLSQIQAVVTLRKVRSKSKFARDGIKYTGSQILMDIQGSPVEIQTRTHWNLKGRSMTASPRVLSPSSILPPPSHFAFIPSRKNSARLSKI